MKVTLVQCPSPLLSEDKVMPPLGILYLAAWLQKFNHEVQVVDLAGIDGSAIYDTLDTDKEWYKLYNADWIGFSCTTPQYNHAKRIAEFLRMNHVKAPMIVGGIHTTSLAHANEMDFLEKDGFSSYCVGEGYNAVTKICEDLDRSGKVSRLYTEPILKDVNDLPYAARELIDIKSYTYKLGDIPATTFYSQYGCPYACQYCESPMAGAWTVRAMHPDRIAGEIKHIVDKWGIYGFHFFDDEMNLDRKRMLGICDKLREISEVVWRGFVVTAKFDGELARACKASGCYEIASGLESGSAEVLRAIRKPATVEINKRFVRTAKAAGLRVKGFFIVGLPGESWQTIYETDKFLMDCKDGGYPIDDVDFSLLQIYPGSPLYQTPQDITFNDIDPDKAYYKSAPGSYEDLVQVQTAKMTKKDLIAARNWLESRWKPPKWMKQYWDRKDYDRVRDSLVYAEKKLINLH
jgi:radical SAM superfamily enzyme YgiQ (UPF0313 family)